MPPLPARVNGTKCNSLIIRTICEIVASKTLSENLKYLASLEFSMKTTNFPYFNQIRGMTLKLSQV
jgi:hypothetical protein